MEKFKYPLASSSWDENEYAALNKVIETGMFSMGAHVKTFEKDFAEHFGSRFAVMVNSGSSANLLMVAALFYTSQFSLKRGDEVIVPAVSWSTSYFPLYQYGLKLKFVDIDPETLNYDLAQFSSAITERTKLVLAVNLLGNPNDFSKLSDLIKGRDIWLIEDNCESMGALFENRFAGTFGVMGSFSTFFSHHLSTMEGGVILTDDEELFHILLCLRAHGWTRNLPEFNKVTGQKSSILFEESFNFVLPGYNVRPLEFSGAVGVEQLKKLDNIIALRRKNAEIFQEFFHENSDIIIQKEIGVSSWFGFSMIIRDGSSIKRPELIELLGSIGVETRPIVAGNFVKNKVCKYFDYEVHGSLASAELVDSKGLFIGNDASDKTDMLRAISNAFKSIK